MNKNHTELYDVLGLKQNASDDEIKRAYRKMAKEFHPDKNKEVGAEETFKKVTHANDILSNPEKRKIYDQFGEEGLNSQFNEGSDPMEEFFRKMNMNQQKKPRTQKQVNITLDEYFTKKTVTITLNRNLKCEPCNATGFTDKQDHRCRKCGGVGIVAEIVRNGPMVQQRQMICPQCKGQKMETSALNLKCKSCNTTCTTTSEEKIEAPIPENITRTQAVLIPEKGNWVDGNYIDLIVIFNLKMPENFGMTQDLQLIHTMHINYSETLCGFRRVINHPSGKKILIISEKGIVVSPDNIYFLDKLGFNNGIMYLTFAIHYPESIKLPNKKQLNFENLDAAMGTRYEPNYDKTDIDPENIYTLNTIKKLNNNGRTRDTDKNNNNNSFDDEDEDYNDNEEQFAQMPGQPDCAQQ